MKQSLILSLLILAVAHSFSCPAWSCKSDITQQKNTGDENHCTEFEDGNKVSLYNQQDACQQSNTNCFLIETLEYINKEATGTLSGSSSYCYSGLVEQDDYYYQSGQVYMIFNKMDCESFNEAVSLCEFYEEDFIEEQYGDENFNDYEEEEGLTGWAKCTSENECQRDNGCYCVPNDGTFGRCSTGWLDDYIIKLAIAEAACDSKDQETYCTISQFQDEVYGTLLTSMLEEDLDCLNDQTWDLQYYFGVDLEKLMKAYNNAYECDDCFSSLLALFSSIILTLL